MKLLSALLCAAVCLPSVLLAGDDLRFQSRDGARTSLIELYTSEGCSSCPPAETWLSRLSSSPQLWTDIVPVAFHVNYWDQLGWRDRFASAAWTTRQREYAAHWGSNSVYTPSFVLDGREWRDWSGYGSGRALPTTNASGEKSSRAGQLTASVKAGKTVTVSYKPASHPFATREVFVALLGNDLNVNVKAGENGGRSLRHDFVVLSGETKKLAPDQSAIFELPAPPADAKRLALAVWIEEPDGSTVEQATGGWLNGTR